MSLKHPPQWELTFNAYVRDGSESRALVSTRLSAMKTKKPVLNGHSRTDLTITLGPTEEEKKCPRSQSSLKDFITCFRMLPFSGLNSPSTRRQCDSPDVKRASKVLSTASFLQCTLTINRDHQHLPGKHHI